MRGFERSVNVGLRDHITDKLLKLWPQYGDNAIFHQLVYQIAHDIQDDFGISNHAIIQEMPYDEWMYMNRGDGKAEYRVPRPFRVNYYEEEIPPAAAFEVEVDEAEIHTLHWQRDTYEFGFLHFDLRIAYFEKFNTVYVYVDQREYFREPIYDHKFEAHIVEPEPVEETEPVRNWIDNDWRSDEMWPKDSLWAKLERFGDRMRLSMGYKEE